jgi:hypothetical protein
VGGREAGTAAEHIRVTVPQARGTTPVDPTRSARRDLVLLGTALVGVSRLADGPLLWPVAILTLVAVAVGSLSVLVDADRAAESLGVPIESVLMPAVTVAGAIGALRLVPLGLGIVPAVALVAILLDRSLRIEARVLGQPHGPTADDRTAILVHAVIVAFIAFVGVAALVPGGLPEPSAPAGAAIPTTDAGLSEGALLLLAAADALVAGLLGYRTSALRVATLRAALWSAATYAGAVAIGAAALRAMTIPRLIGPALLTLVFFLWDAFHGAPPSRRRDPRWIWQTALLIVLGGIVVAWNLGLRA